MNTLEEDKLNKDVLIKELQSKVSVLEEKSDEHEQYSKRDNLLIQGLTMVKPYNKVTENSEDIGAQSEHVEEDWTIRDRNIMKSNIMEFAKNKLKIEMDTSDILTVHTLKTNTQSRKGTCIIRFSNREARDKFYQGRSELYADRQQNRIYINEHLTQKNAMLYKEARELKKLGKVTHAWTRNCRVLVRLKDQTVVHIKNNDFFDRYA